MIIQLLRKRKLPSDLILSQQQGPRSGSQGPRITSVNGAVELSTFTQVLYLSTILRCLYLNISILNNFTILFLYIYLSAEVILQIQISNTKYNQLINDDVLFQIKQPEENKAIKMSSTFTRCNIKGIKTLMHQ